MSRKVTIWRPGLLRSCSGKWTRRRDTSAMKSSCKITWKTATPPVVVTRRLGSLSSTFRLPAMMLNTE
ncbi:uncharacterized protein DMAD_02177 [Drosophila madeirensis]|uniref:Uncharacterized protein n=1 Tax=Drosophila madeirensis TaxID=30013 RepID=A0AAU9G4C7_DROMD